MKSESDIFDNQGMNLIPLNTNIRIKNAKVKTGASEKHLATADIYAHKNAFVLKYKTNNSED